jgi:hypothetical protein
VSHTGNRHAATGHDTGPIPIVANPQKRPATSHSPQAPVKESTNRFPPWRATLVLMTTTSIGLGIGYLAGLSDVDATDIETAGIWFVAAAGLAGLLVAARFFLSDQLYHDLRRRFYRDYQLEARRQAALDRARADASLAQQQAALIRTSIEWTWGIPIGSGRLLVENLHVRAVNESTKPATNVWYRHLDHAPYWNRLTFELAVEDTAERSFRLERPFEAKAEQVFELIPGTEFVFDHDGTKWQRIGDGLPTPVRP